MALRDEIIPFIDGNGLVSPSLSNGQQKASDNGVMYSSEYYIMLEKLKQATDQDVADFGQKMLSCLSPEGILCRIPQPVKDGQEGPDDYFGLMNACMQLGNTDIPRKILWAFVRYVGFLNNDDPGKITAKAFMARFPHLTACMVSAAFPSWKNPLHIIARMACLPIYIYAAIILLLGDSLTPPNNTDSRRLSWHCWQCLKGVSLLCRIGGRIWANRLYKDYGSDGMKAVAAIYYHDAHPFAKYWVTE